ncbi:hypothetical protein ACQU0X_28620 [Pseudovibrio ascidiaceicola]|uniref:hypothetical protein n=1 Tax=Pseudovibrio ascidiaceicola TaxID=285279 RepID=UPI003D35BA80
MLKSIVLSLIGLQVMTVGAYASSNICSGKGASAPEIVTDSDGMEYICDNGWKFKASEVQKANRERAGGEGYQNPTDIALELSSFIGTAERCQLSINSDSLDHFISVKIDPKELGFLSELASFTGVVQRDFDDLSALEQKLQCSQVKRVGQHYGFLN